MTLEQLTKEVLRDSKITIDEIIEDMESYIETPSNMLYEDELLKRLHEWQKYFLTDKLKLAFYEGKKENETFNQFTDEMLLKGETPYKEINSNDKYQEFRNLDALVNSEVCSQMEGQAWYEQYKMDVWRLIRRTVAVVLYVQSISEKGKDG